MLLGCDAERRSASGSLFGFCPSSTFTIEQQNKILPLVTTFGNRRRGRRIDEAPTAQMPNVSQNTSKQFILELKKQK